MLLEHINTLLMRPDVDLQTSQHQSTIVFAQAGEWEFLISSTSSNDVQIRLTAMLPGGDILKMSAEADYDEKIQLENKFRTDFENMKNDAILVYNKPQFVFVFIQNFKVTSISGMDSDGNTIDTEEALIKFLLLELS